MAVAITQTAHPASIATTSNRTIYNSVAIGTASQQRVVAVTISKEVASTTVSTVTIGGIDAVRQDSATFGDVGAYIYSANVPTGTTATIDILWSGAAAINQTQITVYEVTGADYIKASSGNDTSSDMDTTDRLTLAIVVPTNGGALAVAGCAVDSVAKTWANITEDRDDDVGPYRHTTAKRTTSGSVTITCTGGTNQEDGALACVVFKPGYRVDASAGSFAFTGSAASLEWGHEVAAGLGSFAFTGSDATLTATSNDVALVADAGSFAFTGSSAALHRHRLIAGEGSFAFTGENSTSSFGISATAGAFTFTGSAVALVAPEIRLVAGAGSFNYTGSDSIRGLEFVLGSGSFAFTGSNAGFVYIHLLPVTAGSFTFTGFDAALPYLPSFPALGAEVGAFTFTGRDSQADFGINADAGSFAFTGSDAGLSAGTLIFLVEAGEFAFTGSDATVKVDHRIAAAAGSFAFTGAATSLAAHQHLRPESDVSISQWTDQDDGTTDLFAAVDEVTANDTDYVKSPNLDTGTDTLELKLGTAGAPAIDTNHALRVRFRKQNVGAGVTMDFTFALVQGTTVIASSTVPNVGTSFVNAELGLSEAEAASITNYADLRVRLTAAVA